MFDSDDKWYPDLSGRQLEVFNSCARALLVSGPRLSGKTRSTLQRIARHLWETPGARVGMFSKTIKNSKEGGTWELMNSVVIPEWINAGIGMRYTTFTAERRPGPKIDGLSRTPYLSVTNAHGGESKCMLFSLDYDGDVEDKLKEMEFSMIYFSELSKFRSRKVLSVALLSLRMSHLTFDQHMWLADTNPDDEGELSWIYEVWYIMRTIDYPSYVERQKKLSLPVLDQRLFLALQRDLALVEIKPDENPYLDPRQLDELKTECSYDPGMWAKYVEGKWIYGDGDISLHFRTHFREIVHVVGDVSSRNEDEWVYANPHPNSWELVLGLDLGEINHAAVIIDRTIIDGVLCFTVIDEILYRKKEVSIRDFTMELVEMIEEHEEMAGHPFMTERAWSDKNSIDTYSATADTYPYLQVYNASNERIMLRALPKAKTKGAVRVRVELVKQLLHYGRLKVSAHCIHTIEMFKKLPKGKVDYVPTEHPCKHIFDALSYALFMECAEELELGPKAMGTRSTSRQAAISVQVA